MAWAGGITSAYTGVLCSLQPSRNHGAAPWFLADHTSVTDSSSVAAATHTADCLDAVATVKWTQLSHQCGRQNT